jgi:hypothetical protein
VQSLLDSWIVYVFSVDLDHRAVRTFDLHDKRAFSRKIRFQTLDEGRNRLAGDEGEGERAQCYGVPAFVSRRGGLNRACFYARHEQDRGRVPAQRY